MADGAYQSIEVSESARELKLRLTTRQMLHGYHFAVSILASLYIL